MKIKRLKAVTLGESIPNSITGIRKKFSEVLNSWFDKAYENGWSIKHIINHAPKESITIIYEYEEEF